MSFRSLRTGVTSRAFSWLCITAVALFALPASGTAQGLGENRQDASEIVVEGRRTVTDELQRKIGQITRRARFREAMERFTNPVCPRLQGFPSDVFASPILARVKQNISAIGLQTGSADCKPNALIAFVEDAGAMFEALLQSRHPALQDLEKYEIRRIQRETGRSRARHSKVIGDLNGTPMRPVDGDIRVLEPDLTPYIGSRVVIPTSSVIVAAVVLIDLAAIEGMSVTQVADFVTMRVLVPVEEVSAGDFIGPATILSLFAGQGAPAGLTAFDWSYLTCYYSAESPAEKSQRTLKSIVSDYARENQSNGNCPAPLSRVQP